MRKLIVLLMLVLFGCGSFTDEAMFKSNVINPIPDSVQNIHMVKDRSAMHGALFFDFEADENDINLIVQKNNLKPETEIPDVIKPIISHAPWASAFGGKTVNVYGKIIEGEYEWHALYLFVAEKKVYCLKI